MYLRVIIKRGKFSQYNKELKARVEEEVNKAVEVMKRELPEVYDLYEKHKYHQEQYIELSGRNRTFMNSQEHLEKTAAMCGLKLPESLNNPNE